MQQTLWNIFVILIRGLSPRVQELPKSNSWGRKLSGHGFYGANLSPGVCPHLHLHRLGLSPFAPEVCPHLHNSQFMHYIFSYGKFSNIYGRRMLGKPRTRRMGNSNHRWRKPYKTFRRKKADNQQPHGIKRRHKCP